MAARTEANKEWHRKFKEERPEEYKARKAEANRRWRTKNKEDHARRNREWYVANKSLIKGRVLNKKFGISESEYQEMLSAQGSVCAICRSECPSGRRLAVDHCHATAKIRGLLCTPCNTALGSAKDSPSVLRAMIEYIERNQ